MGRVAWMAVGAAIGVGACAYPDFMFNEPTGGAGGTGGQGAATSSSTTTSTTTSSSTSTTGTGGSSCVVTHPGGGTCEYLPGKVCGCSDPSQKCSVIDPTTGESACVTAGTTANYDACTSTEDCKAGSWCELSSSVCEPICAGTCSGGICAKAAQGSTGTATIPGLDVCSIKCDLVTGSPCGPNATCVTDMDEMGTTITICFKSGGAAQDMPCASPQDCAAGLLCTEDPVTMSAACSYWCTPPSGSHEDCPDGYCDSLSSDVDIDGTEYGYCGI